MGQPKTKAPTTNMDLPQKKVMVIQLSADVSDSFWEEEVGWWFVYDA